MAMFEIIVMNNDDLYFY